MVRIHFRILFLCFAKVDKIDNIDCFLFHDLSGGICGFISGNWATIKAEIEAEEDGNYESGGQYNGGHVEYDSENDYVVEKILSRRPLPGTEGSFLETDYEYLVRWEGFDETEDTWEPFEHLERCPVKMKDFHDELKRKAMRCRKGKQLN